MAEEEQPTQKDLSTEDMWDLNRKLTNNGHDDMTADNSVLDLVHVFLPGYSLGADNVYDNSV